MSSEWDETCLVCCEKTKNRCSKCAEAGIDLFFCSPKCQKLVWNVHKRVCGPGKANPFVWPLLSKDESREIIEHMDEPIPRSVVHKTVANAVRHFCEGRADQVRPVIEAVTVGGHAGSDDRDEKVWSQTAEWDIASARDKSAPWDEHGDEPWRTEMRHLVLMHRAVMALGTAASGANDMVAALKQHRARLLACVRTSVAASSPKLAGELGQTMENAERMAKVLSGLMGNL
ncbi:hypothetical protein JCM8208_006585 [Rhodotorula glutinis]